MQNEPDRSESKPDELKPKRLWPLLIGIVLAAAFTSLFGWYASEVAEGETAAFDASVRDAVHSVASPTLTAVMEAASFTGKAAFLTVLGLIFAAVLAYLKLWRSLAIFVITMAGEILLETTLKITYHRARPEPFFDLPVPSSYSFPSGHAMGSLCFYGIVAWIIVRRIDSLPMRIAVWLIASVLFLTIGFSRIYLGVHYPSDVMAGFFAGVVWVSAVIFTDSYIRSFPPRP